MFLSLAGGVGGAKLVSGLSHVLPEPELIVCANTADDFTHLGLRICPDLDTLIYTLAGLSNRSQGWGVEDETWHFMQQLERLGAETWFRLGDKDLAMHVERTRLLDSGMSLSAVTSQLRKKLGVATQVVPMTDDAVSTLIHTDEGTLPFQYYFVKRQCIPRVKGWDFLGIGQAKPSAGFMRALGSPALQAVILCPSNPFVSLDPILSLPSVREQLRRLSVPIVAVSPIVDGRAIKGPAAKMLAELGLEVSALEIAARYRDILTGFVLDDADADLAEAVRQLGMEVLIAPTVMHSIEEKDALALRVLQFISSLSYREQGHALMQGTRP